jgi:hypothetical protein
MSDQLLGLLRIGLLGLLYLFFGRVLWAVWSEVRAPRTAPTVIKGKVPSAPAATTAAPPRSRGKVTKLVMLEPKRRKGETFLVQGGLVIGRAPSCAIVLDDDSFVSQLHARVDRRDDQVWVEDLGSTNGTYVNGAKLHAPAGLSNGDRITIGSAVLEAR